MDAATERVADLGLARVRDGGILLQVNWPSDAFSQVMMLVCSGMVCELRATTSPFEDETAVVRWLTFETDEKSSCEAKGDCWFVSKRRRKKSDAEQQSPVHVVGPPR
jgi:hypothetical protein